MDFESIASANSANPAQKVEKPSSLPIDVLYFNRFSAKRNPLFPFFSFFYSTLDFLLNAQTQLRAVPPFSPFALFFSFFTFLVQPFTFLFFKFLAERRDSSCAISPRSLKSARRAPTLLRRRLSPPLFRRSPPCKFPPFPPKTPPNLLASAPKPDVRSNRAKKSSSFSLKKRAKSDAATFAPKRSPRRNVRKTLSLGGRRAFRRTPTKKKNSPPTTR